MLARALDANGVAGARVARVYELRSASTAVGATGAGGDRGDGVSAAASVADGSSDSGNRWSQVDVTVWVRGSVTDEQLSGARAAVESLLAKAGVSPAIVVVDEDVEAGASGGDSRVDERKRGSGGSSGTLSSQAEDDEWPATAITVSVLCPGEEAPTAGQLLAEAGSDGRLSDALAEHDLALAPARDEAAEPVIRSLPQAESDALRELAGGDGVALAHDESASPEARASASEAAEQAAREVLDLDALPHHADTAKPTHLDDTVSAGVELSKFVLPVALANSVADDIGANRPTGTTGVEGGDDWDGADDMLPRAANEGHVAAANEEDAFTGAAGAVARERDSEASPWSGLRRVRAPPQKSGNLKSLVARVRQLLHQVRRALVLLCKETRATELATVDLVQRAAQCSNAQGALRDFRSAQLNAASLTTMVDSLRGMLTPLEAQLRLLLKQRRALARQEATHVENLRGLTSVQAVAASMVRASNAKEQVDLHFARGQLRSLASRLRVDGPTLNRLGALVDAFDAVADSFRDPRTDELTSVADALSEVVRAEEIARHDAFSRLQVVNVQLDSLVVRMQVVEKQLRTDAGKIAKTGETLPARIRSLVSATEDCPD